MADDVVIFEHIATGTWKPVLSEDGSIVFFDNDKEAQEYIRNSNLCDPYIMTLETV